MPRVAPSGATAMNATRTRGTHSHRWVRAVLLAAVLFLMADVTIVVGYAHAAPRDVPSATITSIRVVRTAAGAASVVGTTDSPTAAIDVLVNGNVVTSGLTAWTGDYWFLDVPVSDANTVQTRMGSSLSAPAVVSPYLPQPVGPAGFVYAQGSTLRINGTTVQLFGVDEQYAFIYGMIASGLWGPTDTGAWGKNGLFPSGPDGYIAGITDADSLWREYFRYFLHYQQTGGSPGHPRPNLLRIWVADHTWNPEGTYNAWKSNPAKLWNLFDRMLYWANRAGVYVVPVLGHFATIKDNRFFDMTTTYYAHQIEVVSAIMDRYNGNPQIAMWDAWNEPDVDNDAYWGSVGGIVGFKAWATAYIAAIEPHTSNHLITMGIGGWDLFPGVPGFSWEYEYFWNDIPGLDVGHHHTYGTSEDQYLIDWSTDWQKALGKPHYEGETGYNAWPGPSPLGYGYWPWFTQATRADGMAGESTMVFMDNGKGAYADYPYSGSLPNYPAGGPPPNQPPTAAYSFSPPGPQPAQLVTFDGSTSSDSDGTIVSYAWMFGDGATGSGSATTHSYATTGSYSATLTVTDNGSLTGSVTKTIPVTSTDTTPPARVTDLRVVTVAPSSVTLRWTAPGDDGTTGTATWYDFRYSTAGAITQSNFWMATHFELLFFPHAPGTTEEATITGLAGATTYWFALQASDEVPNWSLASNSPSGTTGSPDVPPTASFTCTPCTPTVGQTVSFDGSASSDPDGTIVTYAWAFGDGSTATRSTPTAQHVYGSTGSYTVTLDVTDNANLTTRATQTVTVATPPPPDTPPTASFSSSPANPTVGQAVTFDASASTDDHGIVAYAWTFGDGGQGQGSVVTHAYATAGDFQVQLTVMDTVGSNGTASSSIHVTAPVPPPDTTPPATISSLAVASVGNGSATIRWTAPGDDGAVGQATWYDLRYRTGGPITDANFYAAVHVQIPVPLPAGSSEQAVVTGLGGGTQYWFAVRASDEVPNWSGTSNSPSGTTPGDATPPSAITDLRVYSIGRTYVVLRWTAPGDDGTAGKARSYDLRYSMVGPITDSNFYGAVRAQTGPPKSSGSIEDTAVSGLRATTRYWFAVRASDEVPNWAGTSNSQGALTLRRSTGPYSEGCFLCGPDLLSDLSTPEGMGQVALITLEFVALAEAFVIAVGLLGRRRRPGGPGPRSGGTGIRGREGSRPR